MILFTWENCTKCDEVKNYIKENNIEIEILDNTTEEWLGIQSKYRIMSVPCLIKDNNIFFGDKVIPNL